MLHVHRIAGLQYLARLSSLARSQVEGCSAAFCLQTFIGSHAAATDAGKGGMIGPWTLNTWLPFLSNSACRMLHSKKNLQLAARHGTPLSGIKKIKWHLASLCRLAVTHSVPAI